MTDSSTPLREDRARDDQLTIGRGISIPVAEIELRTSRSSGPGGQHVNTSDTRVELRFDVAHSPSLPEEARTTLLEHLGSRLTKEGILRVTAQAHRSQWRNRDDALSRLAAILARCLREPTTRVATAPTQGSRARRRREKEHRSRVKRSRAVVDDE